jgi:caffeoyl-CoA O-methyltransferase
MSKTFGNDDPALAEYVGDLYLPEDQILIDARTRSAAAGLPDIQVAPLDGRHLEVLARLSGARRAVEIGTLGGYSGVALLRGMGGAGGNAQLDTIEIDPRHAEIARETFRRAGFTDHARVHVGPALQMLPGLSPDGPFDLVFIDADKDNYAHYLDWATDNLRSGGLVLVDNAFLFGHLPERPVGPRAVAIRAMQSVHEALARGGKFRATVLPTGEGLAVGVRV